MPSPYEMVAGVTGVWSAPASTPAPEISQPPPAGTWELVGTREGAGSISEDGIEFQFTETIEAQRDTTSSAVQKLFRQDQDLLITLGVIDLSVDTFAEALGHQSPVTVPAGIGTAGYVQTSLLRPGQRDDVDGFRVNLRSFLVRIPSPYQDPTPVPSLGHRAMENWQGQFWVPKAYASLSGPVHFTKGESASLDLEILAVLDETHGYGHYRAQNAHPLA